MNTSLSSSVKVGFPIGSLYFGALVGPSMISGIFAKVYLSPYGVWGFLFALGQPLVTGIIVGFCAEIVRRNKVYDYNSFCHLVYGKYSALCTPIMELYLLAAQILTVSAVVSMGGTFINQIFGWKPIYGSLLLAAICLLLVIKGAEVVRRASAAMAIILVIAFGFLSIYCAAYRSDVLFNIISTAYVPPEANMAYGIRMALLFAFSAASWGMLLVSVMQKVETTRHAFSAGFWSFLLASIVLLLENLMILPYYPEVMASDVPTMWIIQNFLVTRLSWLPTLYFIVMFFALITSGVPANQSMIARASISIPRKGIFRNEIVLRTFIGLVFLAVVLFISQFGLTAIVSKGYSSLGFIGVLLIFIPVCIITPLNWRRERLAAEKKELLT